jgi:hypothetical protein
MPIDDALGALIINETAVDEHEIYKFSSYMPNGLYRCDIVQREKRMRIKTRQVDEIVKEICFDLDKYMGLEKEDSEYIAHLNKILEIPLEKRFLPENAEIIKEFKKAGFRQNEVVKELNDMTKQVYLKYIERGFTMVENSNAN